MHAQPGANAFAGPVIIAVRGPSRSGKTAMVERLIAALRTEPVSIGYVKRTHHLLDLPQKASGRVWASGPSAMLLRATDRTQLTLPPTSPGAEGLLASLPPSVDLVLLETHEPEPYPTIASELAAPSATGGDVLASWALPSIDTDASRAAAAVRALLPADPELMRALRSVMAAGAVHHCAGIVLGTRLALEGLRALGLPPGVPHRGLRVVVETRRCALDALTALTGCGLGHGTLAISDYGKLAATFIDDGAGRALRVSARPGLRDRVTPPAGAQLAQHDAQRSAYLSLPGAELFCIQEAVYPGPRLREPHARFDCRVCGEEVTVGADAPAQRLCTPCARDARVSAQVASSNSREKVLVS